MIALRPICPGYRAPLLGPAVPAEGLVPVVLFDVGRAMPDEVARLQNSLFANGFAVAGGSPTINKTKILFASGEGVLKTQPMADRLYGAICGLDQKNVRLVHFRYNQTSEANRMI